MKSTVYTYGNVDRVRASLNGMMSEKKVVWGYENTGWIPRWRNSVLHSIIIR